MILIEKIMKIVFMFLIYISLIYSIEKVEKMIQIKSNWKYRGDAYLMDNCAKHIKNVSIIGLIISMIFSTDSILM